MADIAETVTGVVPHMGMTLIYFTATKAAQNDTITFAGYRAIVWAAGMVDPGGSTDWSAETITVEGTSGSENIINLTGATTGTIYGIALAIV